MFSKQLRRVLQKSIIEERENCRVAFSPKEGIWSPFWIGHISEIHDHDFTEIWKNRSVDLSPDTFYLLLLPPMGFIRDSCFWSRRWSDASISDMLTCQLGQSTISWKSLHGFLVELPSINQLLRPILPLSKNFSSDNGNHQNKKSDSTVLLWFYSLKHILPLGYYFRLTDQSDYLPQPLL